MKNCRQKLKGKKHADDVENFMILVTEKCRCVCVCVYTFVCLRITTDGVLRVIVKLELDIRQQD